MKHATVTAVIFLLAITQGSADFQCPPATFVELGKDVLIDCLISDVNDIYWLRGTEEDHYPIVKIEMGLKTISKVAQDHFDITDSGALVIRDASDDLTGSYVMLHYRTNLVREVDTVTLNVTTLVDSIIIQGPSGGVYPMGSNITLTCTFQKGYVVGWKEYENKDIFVADTKVTADTKYDNFRVSLSDRISNLQIIGADLEDAGKYLCNTESYAHVEIEAPPSFRIMFNDTDDEGTDSTDSYGVIDITCTAKNARPAVMIRFKTDDSEWINPSETWTVSNGVTFDTYATLKFSFVKKQTDVFVTCQTFGQKTVPPMEKTLHLSTPTCSLQMNTIEATCNCVSNPPVYKYILSTDGKMEVGRTLNVEDLGGSTISCTGLNHIGVGTSKSSVVQLRTGASFLVYVIIIVCLVVVILGAVIALVVCRRRKKRKSPKNRKQGDHSQNDPSETEKLVDRGSTVEESKDNSTKAPARPSSGSTDEDSKDVSVKTFARPYTASTDEGHTSPSTETSAVPPSETTASYRIFGVSFKKDDIDDSTETKESNSKFERSKKTSKNSTTGDKSLPSVHSGATKPEAEVKYINVGDRKMQWMQNALNDSPEKFHNEDVKKELAKLKEEIRVEKVIPKVQQIQSRCDNGW